MAFRGFDPRGDLPPPMVMETRRRPPQPQPQALTSKPIPCYDWIFNSASNVHVAVDRSSFKTYTPFKSYVLTVADQRKVKVRGVGTVQLRIRRQPGSKESHAITLENVLHVPGWLCNLFSDIYFSPVSYFEHTWTDFGVSFLTVEENRLHYWGFTEGFLGLERLVLAKKIRGRSPMLEDKDREVFSVSITWPQGQRDKWEAMVLAEENRQTKKEEQKPETNQDTKTGLSDMSEMIKSFREGSLGIRRDHRSGLVEITGNTMRRGPSARISSLKALTSSHGPTSEALAKA